MKKILCVLPLVAVACGGTSSNSKGGPAHGLAVLSSDYKSTTVSLVDTTTGMLAQDDCIDSGAVAPKLSMALSGDLALASQPQSTVAGPGGELLLIDRTNSALVWLDPLTCQVLRQLPVGTGFFSNPHDLVQLSPTKAYVTRFELNAKPSGMAGANDQGNDLLIIDPSQPAITGRIDFTAEATHTAGATLEARPDRALYVDGKVYVSLAEQSGDYKVMGPARIAVVDPTSDRVTASVDLPNERGCSQLAYLADEKLLLASCSGDYNSPATQASQSGIVKIDVSGATPRVVGTLPATLFGDHPVSSLVLAAVSDHLLLAVTNGDVSGTPPDSLWAADPAAGTASKILDASASFIYGSMVADVDAHRLYLPDAATESPSIDLFDLTQSAAISKTGHFDADPSRGLPPRQIARY